MRAIQLDIIETKPYLTDSSLKTIYKVLADNLNTLELGERKPITLDCLNGIKVEVTMKESGYSYRKVDFFDLYVMYKDSNDDLVSIPEYEEALINMLEEDRSNINYNAEEEYYEREEVCYA